MSKPDIRFAIFFCDLEADLCAVPLVFICKRIQVAVRNQPNDFFIGNNFDQLVLAVMKVFVSITEFIIKFMCRAFNLSGPSSTNIIDGIEYFPGSLINHQGSGEILGRHGFEF